MDPVFPSRGIAGFPFLFKLRYIQVIPSYLDLSTCRCQCILGTQFVLPEISTGNKNTLDVVIVKKRLIFSVYPLHLLCCRQFQDGNLWYFYAFSVSGVNYLVIKIFSCLCACVIQVSQYVSLVVSGCWLVFTHLLSCWMDVFYVMCFG